jgi:RNA polymerase sigma factor (sigma-70 family)
LPFSKSTTDETQWGNQKTIDELSDLLQLVLEKPRLFWLFQIGGCIMYNYPLKLIEEAQFGNQEAINELADLLYRDLHSRAIAELPAGEDPEDFANYVSYKILHSLRRFRWECGFSTWVGKIFRYELIDVYRKKDEKEFLTLECIENTVLEFVVIEQPDLIAEARELCATVQDALDSLRKRRNLHYKTFFLWWYEGMSYKEIAEYLDIPINTVKSDIFKAREAFQKLLLSRGITPD